MANLIDFLSEHGSSNFKAFPFCEADALVCARVSYLPFEKIGFKDGIIISDCAALLLKLSENDFLLPDDIALVKSLKNSARYSALSLFGFEKTDSVETEKQFAAVSIKLSTFRFCVSFRGTDGSLNGWKEDFNMAYTDLVPCRKAGADYLKRMSKKHPISKFIVCGHSKGGNVALYSAVSPEAVSRRKIVSVFNFDGPGFSEKFLGTVSDKSAFLCKTFIPQDSVIGRLLSHKEKIAVIKSDENMLREHNIYSWQIKGGALERLPHATQTSDALNQTVESWLEASAPEERRLFVDTVFDILSTSDAQNFEDIGHNIQQALPKMVIEAFSLKPEQRKNISSMIKLFVTAFLQNIKGEKEKSLPGSQS